MRIFTWHIHGSYLYYLTQANHEFYLPVLPGKPEGYGGRNPGFAWGDNVHEVPAEEVRHLDFDCILFQSRKNYLHDQYEILSQAQQQLPCIYLEHDPPQEHPTNTKHIVDDPNVLLIHVTDFNRLMWDNGRSPTRTIEHGVVIPADISYSGQLAKGLVVTNGLRKRGRRLGADIFTQVRESIPLDLVGMDAESLGGLGEVPHAQLPAFAAQYRFFFHSVRYTSLGLAVCEAMMLGLPVIGLATTELVTVVENGVSGYVDTNIDRLIESMQELIANPDLAHRLSIGAKKQAQQRFNIQRFTRDWDAAFLSVAGRLSIA
ncbi:glycosyl transferase group 1 [Gloeocapsa sp. PCC 7428]|uniref:glycosyltransferase n=1 Tax=Gloeocapsa sp. PCC 7428 TaxID=1173026 RepID=UPI0002A5E8EA|nr:glycosyltransferase [Gloeocapsa sp. PCC 7428]AFZ32435.1 glycosyl transferase group 1 [Gloeocapsa sp. PCC 7428]